ncbi:MAG: ABC transporter permease, partial [Anaerolineae bacterium]
HTMGEPPGRCLLTPIFQANLLIQPVLTFLFTLAALVGGNLIFTQVLHRRTLAYQARVLDALNADDVLLALLKALTFGATIALVGYQTGRQDTRSAEDVGRASRTAVVLASTIIILADLVLSHVLAVW